MDHTSQFSDIFFTSKKCKLNVRKYDFLKLFYLYFLTFDRLLKAEGMRDGGTHGTHLFPVCFLILKRQILHLKRFVATVNFNMFDILYVNGFKALQKV